MIWDKDNTEIESSLSFAKKVLKTMAEREVLLDLTELVFVCDSIVLNANLPFFPLGP